MLSDFSQILPWKTILQYMCDAYGSQAGDCWAFIGTCISREDYEVDSDVADHFAAAFKEWNKVKGKYFVDLKSANAAALHRKGVSKAQIEVSEFSTIQHNNRYFSHRAEYGHTGRMLAVIGLR